MHTKEYGNKEFSALQDDMQNVKEKLRETASALSCVAGDVKDRAEDMFQRSWQEVKDRSQFAEDSALSYARKNPMKTLGFSVLAGMLLAQFFKSK